MSRPLRYHNKTPASVVFDEMHRGRAMGSMLGEGFPHFVCGVAGCFVNDLGGHSMGMAQTHKIKDQAPPFVDVS